MENKKKTSIILNNLLYAIGELKDLHAPRTSTYLLLKQVARKEIEYLFNTEQEEFIEFGPFGKLIFPYFKMGGVDSLDLFGLDELIIFSFYYKNKDRYKQVIDIGANIGLHTIMMSKCGFTTKSYEPDPMHFKILKKNLALNNCENSQLTQAAVSYREGTQEFVRLVGNTTGSCLEGSKEGLYGKLEKFPVNIVNIKKIINWADLIKLDVEGHEKDILIATTTEDWKTTDALVEVGSEENASAIYQHFKNLGVNMFSQKNNWNIVQNLNDIPTSYKEGTLFISTKKNMPW